MDKCYYEYKDDGDVKYCYPGTQVLVNKFDIRDGQQLSKVDKSTEEWLDGIEDRLEYGKWYCGHYHTEKKIDRVEIMFENFDVLYGDDRRGKIF